MEQLINKLNEVYFAAPPAFRFAYFIWFSFFLIYYFAGLYEKHHKTFSRNKKKINFHIAFPAILALAFLFNHIGIYNNKQAYMTSDLGWIASLNIIGYILLTLGFIIVLQARAVLNGYWGPHIYEYTEPLERKLVTKNIYSQMRHPIYSGQILMAFGTFLLSNNWWILGFPIILLFINILRAKTEDKYLETEFNKQFIEYRDQVVAWIPGLF